MSEVPDKSPKNKQDLFSLFQKTRQEFASTWKDLTEEELIQRPGPTPEWSMKDTLAHVVWWETFAISRITILAAGEGIKVIENYQQINDRVFFQVQNMPWSSVLASFKANQNQLESLIDSLSFEEWTDQTRANFEGHPLLVILAANTYEHYYEHLDDFRTFRDKMIDSRK